MNKTRPLLLALLVASVLHAQERAPGNDTIRKEALRSDLFFLASDEMRGRLTDSPENRLAAQYIRSRFERMGLKPAGRDGSFFQPYNLVTMTLGEPNGLEVEQGGGATLRLRVGQDYYPQRISASGRVRAPLVFVGFGLSSPALGYDDYQGDVKGTIVLAIEHEPGERDPNSPFEGVISTEAASPLRKALAAQEKGAAGILFVADVHNHPGPSNFEAAARTYWPEKPPRIQSYTLASWVDRVRIPVAQISPALAATLVRGSGRSFADLSRSAETARGLAPVAIPGPQIDLAVSVDRHIVPDQNVVAAIEGADARLKDEWVILCAHFDHNGGDGPQILNGADDNGSGTIALLEIAEAYAQAAREGRRPRRSVLFAAWNSEERGLLGAWAYAEQPLVPLANTVAVLNMDMVGRNEEVPEGGGTRFRGLEIQTAQSNNNAVNLLGHSRVPDLRAIVEKANKGIGLDLKQRYDNNSSQLLRRSDHWPFLQHEVPAIGFATGLHPDYHTVYDRPEKINYDKLTKIARLVHQASWDLATGDARPAMGVRKTSTVSREF